MVTCLYDEFQQSLATQIDRIASGTREHRERTKLQSMRKNEEVHVDQQRVSVATSSARSLSLARPIIDARATAERISTHALSIWHFLSRLLHLSRRLFAYCANG